MILRILTAVAVYFVIFLLALHVFNKLICFWCKSKVCLVGKTALITGGTSGIGYQAALELAAKGCKVIIADVIDTSKAIEEIIRRTHNPHVIGKRLDLASFQSVRECVRDIYNSETRLDILINNAGIGNVNVVYTKDGLDRTMQINYFGHFLLTHLLLDLLKKSTPSRIVFTSSVVAYLSNLTPKNLNPTEDYSSITNVLLPGGTYGASKLCLAIAGKMFGQKLSGTGVVANSYNPGGTRTNIFFKNVKTWSDYYRMFVGLTAWIYGKTTEEAIQTLIYMVQADETKNITGKMFTEGRAFLEPFQLRNPKFCQEIWDKSIIYTNLAQHEVKC